ncbi:MAG: hypothetical protein R3B70_30710 [Polyangiaceae bacterium]
MTFRLVEGDLCFDFDDRWKPILAWDRHVAYRRGIHAIDGSRAVDIVGVYRGRTLYFIEVKDYRVHTRTKPIDPRRELDSKVRNTVAGLVGASRRPEHADECRPLVRALCDLQVPLHIVFWYETPTPPKCLPPNADKRERVGLLFAGRSTDRDAKWLNARVLSTRRTAEYQDVLPGLVVTSLARKRRRTAEKILEILQERRISFSEEIRRRIEDCLDERDLERWRERSKVVASAVELFDARK